MAGLAVSIADPDKRLSGSAIFLEFLYPGRFSSDIFRVQFGQLLRLPVWPTPPICNATLIETPNDIQTVPRSFSSNPFDWIFVETSFDFGTRMRRGRLYRNFGNLNALIYCSAKIRVWA